MAPKRTYLELSQETGAHKFYEVVLDDTSVSIRYGRIGTQGQSNSKTYATAEKAQADANKKIQSKLKKGYESAVEGARKKRPITRRSITSHQSQSNQAPTLWRFNTGEAALGIFISETDCWVGNQSGQIYTLTPEGKITRKFQLPDGVKCIVADDDWLYAGCDNGKVYDLNGKVPRVAYEISNNVDIFWIDICDGILGVSDRNGQITIINHEEESQWTQKSQGISGWMVRCDEIGVYHGHSAGVTMYDWEDGHKIWHQPTQGEVLFGWQEESQLFAGTGRHKIHGMTKKGIPENIYSCDASVYSCAAAEDGKYVFAGDNYSSVYCFNAEGTRLWKLATGCGSAYSMQYLNDRLYIVTTKGVLACIDVSESAIQSAQSGTVPEVKDIKFPKMDAVAASADVEQTSETQQGVILECYKQGGSLKVRVISSGYDTGWNVQFPKNLREEGAKFVVDEVRESTRGGFYRAYGDIKRLV